MTEQQIQKKIIQYLEQEGYYVVKVISASKSGVPDILTCIEGRFVGIEVKKPETKTNVSKLQEYNLDKINEAGGVSTVAWEVEQVKIIVSAIKKDMV